MKIHIITYGCSNNIAESQIMEKILREGGHKITGLEKADLVIINSCSVKSVTENKIIHKIRSIEESGKKIIIAGCMPESEYHILKEISPQASLLSTHHIDQAGKAAEAVFNGEYVEILGKATLDKSKMKKYRANPVIDIIPISQGCRSLCTFCSTRMAKGDLHSYPEKHILASMKSGIKEGTMEFWITSQDNGCYGFDGKTDLSQLTRKITNLEGDFKIRIGMMNPEHALKFLPELIEAYKSEKVFKFLHLPVQSGSNTILKRMGRRYTAEDFIFIIKQFRKEIPDITIWTDIIAGFPGETEEDFLDSLDLVKKMNFDFVNISAYGNRPGTPASRMKQIPTQVKKERTRKLALLAKRAAENQNKRWLGWEGPVLVDEYNSNKSSWIGRNFAYKPVVLKGKYRLGQTIKAKITDCSSNSLFAKAQLTHT